LVSDLAEIRTVTDRPYHNDKTTRVYAFDVRAVAHALGGNVIGRNKVAAPGPAHSSRDRSLVVMLSDAVPDGFVCHSHAGDDWQTCKAYVRQRLGLPQWEPGDGRNRRVAPSRIKAFGRTAVNDESERRERTRDDLIRIERAVAIWDEAVEPRGTLAETYTATRKLMLDDNIAGAVLRFNPSTPWRDENTGAVIYLPALIAAFRSIDDDAITAVHRIRLDQPERWPKAQRMMLGLVHRSAVKLGQATEMLHVGEGVETCMAAHQLGHAPAWALGSAGMIAQFPVLDGVACLRILGESGPASAGAIKHCGDRWHAAGRKVQIVMSDVGSDLNDELMAGP
jgi:hypothetical protein